MLPIKTIVHPTDFSDLSGNAFQMACALARDYGAKLVLLHVRQPPPVVYGEMVPLPPEPAATKQALRDKLANLKPTDAAIAVERKIVDGDPAVEILREAKEAKADLVVLGTHGRTGLGRLLMGSVAEQVVRKATCPVLTVKTPIAEKVVIEQPAREPAYV